MCLDCMKKEEGTAVHAHTRDGGFQESSTDETRLGIGPSVSTGVLSWIYLARGDSNG